MSVAFEITPTGREVTTIQNGNMTHAIVKEPNHETYTVTHSDGKVQTTTVARAPDGRKVLYVRLLNADEIREQ